MTLAMIEPTSTIRDRLQRAWERKFIDGPDFHNYLVAHGFSEDAIETIDASLNFVLAYLVPSRLPAEAEPPTKPTGDPLPERLLRYAESSDRVEFKRDLREAAAALAQLPPRGREYTDAMRSVAFNYAEGFAGASTVTASEVLDAYYAIRDAAPTGIPRDDARLLATAIRDAAVKAGIARPDAPLTGPDLLMLCDDLANAALHEPTPTEQPAVPR